MSVPIRLPMTVTFGRRAGSVVPEIDTPIRLAEMTLPGPTWVSDDEMATPSSRLPSTSPPSAVQPDDVARDDVPSAAVLPVMSNAGHGVGRDHVAGAGGGAADHVVRGVLDLDAVASVAGIPVPEDVTAAGRRADLVAGDDILRRAVGRVSTISTPSPALCEMTFPAPDTPIRLLDDSTRTPWAPLPAL